VFYGCYLYLELPTFRSSASNIHDLKLKGLQFNDSILEGEILNRGTRTVKEVWVHVAFESSSGVIAIEQDFRVIPGGDGKPIPSGWSKHFKYHLKLNGSAELTPKGYIKSVLH
jgi:hypothetical protein